ncbi:Membrane protein involved in the export of O-antigen and teichoic acid [Pedobacter suwonensis]|uniref:Membrane protein involved in the export of O-antigen and teichoic acid n=1 Tax=Pedobacter suwonensis TaxID=332999 RepID=A0A1I0SRT2_9SPHI|nr:flippase [Pedobacter suwonensis]SFA42258.1 Membrane protein involved in the export of O-antigen and teichoic acid [Pedobacter suwonensis]
MSIKKNFLYNGILSASNYIFPFLTFTYVSRTLGVENLGKCSFVDGIVNYFLLFASLGIGTIGVREIAKTNDDSKAKSRVFSSLLIFNLISTVIVCIVYVIGMVYVSKLAAYKELLYIGLAKIISTLFLIEWFFIGIENFKFITTRSILIKLIYIALVFLLISDSQDYKLYFLLTAVSTIINALFNIFHARKFVKFSFKGLAVQKYIRPMLIMGMYGLLTYMYTSFNVIYLGFISGDKEVGYYTTATKIYTILLSVFTAFTSVMLPRISLLVEEKKFEETRVLINKSYEILFCISIPLLVVCGFLAPQIIELIAGKGFEGAVLPMQIIMPLLLIIGVAQILVVQILMPFNSDRSVFINSLIGAAIGVILNLLLIGKLHSVGSAIVLLVSELAVVISADYFVKKEINFTIPYKSFITNLLFAVPYIAFCLLAQAVFISSFVIVISVWIVSCIYFVLIQKYFIKNVLFLQIEEKLRGIVFNKLAK